jgi:hypothetical protein
MYTMNKGRLHATTLWVLIQLRRMHIQIFTLWKEAINYQQPKVDGWGSLLSFYIKHETIEFGSSNK